MQMGSPLFVSHYHHISKILDIVAIGFMILKFGFPLKYENFWKNESHMGLGGPHEYTSSKFNSGCAYEWEKILNYINFKVWLKLYKTMWEIYPFMNNVYFNLHKILWFFYVKFIHP